MVTIDKHMIKENIENEYGLSSLRIEKLVPSQKAIILCQQISEERITLDAAVTAVLEQYRIQKNKK